MDEGDGVEKICVADDRGEETECIAFDGSWRIGELVEGIFDTPIFEGEFVVVVVVVEEEEGEGEREEEEEEEEDDDDDALGTNDDDD